MHTVHIPGDELFVRLFLLEFLADEGVYGWSHALVLAGETHIAIHQFQVLLSVVLC